MAINGEKFCKMRNQQLVTMHVIYANVLIVALE